MTTQGANRQRTGPAAGSEGAPATEADAVTRARRVADVIRGAVTRIEAGRALPADVVAALHEARMFRLLLPRTLGGDELHLKTLAQTIEVIASVDASTAWCLGQGAGCAMASAYLKPEVARRFFGPPDAVLAWGAGIAGKAVATDGGYRVTGKWMFASGAANATLLGGHSYVFEKDGSPRMRADGRQVDRTALFAYAKANVHDMWHTLGLRGTASYTYEVNDLFVPEEETIDREEPAERVEQGTLFLFPATQAYAAAFSSLMLGIATSLVRDLKALATTKTPRAAPSTLKESPVFQMQLAILEARLRACRAYLHTTLDDAWAHTEAVRNPTIEDAANLKLATTYVINQGVEIATEAYRAAGATAIFPTNPFERRLRDALSASQQVQGRPSNFTTIGRVMLGLPPDTPLLT
ncbi:MAG TPA: acyl-CoA dehydrogenase family protein [Hyphomicrobiaceae bacterium]|nr:acyl-CoA dehydrogenase family protein [Hyphomicrobiaceae bacterium]